jgi:bifunctional DNA-binding transcriptional regulator/antitoxin component of YhaV-PrlF toxin-antitoxin module
LLETLGLKEGDTVRVELDVDTSTIVIRKAEAPPTDSMKVRARAERT